MDPIALAETLADNILIIAIVLFLIVLAVALGRKQREVNKLKEGYQARGEEEFEQTPTDPGIPLQPTTPPTWITQETPRIEEAETEAEEIEQPPSIEPPSISKTGYMAVACVALTILLAIGTWSWEADRAKHMKNADLLKGTNITKIQKEITEANRAATNRENYLGTTAFLAVLSAIFGGKYLVDHAIQEKRRRLEPIPEPEPELEPEPEPEPSTLGELLSRPAQPAQPAPPSEQPRPEPEPEIPTTRIYIKEVPVEVVKEVVKEVQVPEKPQKEPTPLIIYHPPGEMNPVAYWMLCLGRVEKLIMESPRKNETERAYQKYKKEHESKEAESSPSSPASATNAASG